MMKGNGTFTFDVADGVWINRGAGWVLAGLALAVWHNQPAAAGRHFDRGVLARWLARVGWIEPQPLAEGAAVWPAHKGHPRLRHVHGGVHGPSHHT